MTIYLNVVTGSRELEGCEINKAITEMAIRLSAIRKALENNDKAKIDLTLILPAKSQRPDFEGMRMISFSRDDGTLFMESTIPEAMLHSQQAPRYLSALLQDAVENASEFFVENGLDFSEKEWIEVLGKEVSLH